eukprot:3864657-Amphidinium_carterae.1
MGIGMGARCCSKDNEHTSGTNLNQQHRQRKTSRKREKRTYANHKTISKYEAVKEIWGATLWGVHAIATTRAA